MLTAQAAVQQGKAAEAETQMTDAEWILRAGPQRLRPSHIGMTLDDSGAYVRYADMQAITGHFKAALREIIRDDLTAETPKEQFDRVVAIALRALGGAK